MSRNKSKMDPALAEALQKKEIRFFTASRGSAKGKTGEEDTSRFAENLMVLQECAILIGEKLEMSAVSQAICYEGDETFGFCFDQNSNPQNPSVAGGIVNQRLPMEDFASAVRDFINR